MTSSFRAIFPVLSVSLSGNSPPSANETLVAKPVTERPPLQFLACRRCRDVGQTGRHKICIVDGTSHEAHASTGDARVFCLCRSCLSSHDCGIFLTQLSDYRAFAR